MKCYKGIVLKEIFWNARTYKQGSSILIHEDDLQILTEAKVVGDVAPYEMPKKVEYAVKEEPETAMKEHGIRNKGRRARR